MSTSSPDQLTVTNRSFHMRACYSFGDKPRPKTPELQRSPLKPTVELPRLSVLLHDYNSSQSSSLASLIMGLAVNGRSPPTAVSTVISPPVTEFDIQIRKLSNC